MEVTPSARPDWVRSVADAAPGPIGFDPSRAWHPARLGSIRRGRGTRPDWVRSVAGRIGFDPSPSGGRGCGMGSIRRGRWVRPVRGRASGNWVRSAPGDGFALAGGRGAAIGFDPSRGRGRSGGGPIGFDPSRAGERPGRGVGFFPIEEARGPARRSVGVDGGGFVDIVGSSGEKASRRRTFRSYSLRIAVGKHTFSPRWSIFPRSGILNFRRAGWSLPYVRKEAGGQASAGGAARASMASNSASTLAAKSAWIW